MWEYQDLLTLKSSKAFNQKKKFQSHLLPPRVIINFIHKRTASNPPISLHKIPNPSLKIHEPKPKTQEKKENVEVRIEEGPRASLTGSGVTARPGAATSLSREGDWALRQAPQRRILGQEWSHGGHRPRRCTRLWRRHEAPNQGRREHRQDRRCSLQDLRLWLRYRFLLCRFVLLLFIFPLFSLFGCSENQ